MSKGADCTVEPALSDRINSFAVVCYIPGALGEFITKLRQELVSGCVAQSHVTILPPRALFASQEELESAIIRLSGEYPPFVINMPRLAIFRQTSVIFAEIGEGKSQLLEMHERLAVGPLAAEEPFEYHPHITLAQGINPEDVDAVFEMASRRWNESPSTSALIENLTFVQNTVQNRWIDLVQCELSGAIAVGR
jgi:2'-5' RNA ligase